MTPIEITTVQTHELRRRVLRDGDAAAEVDWPGDDEPTTLHLGIEHRGRIVAISTWLRRPEPDGGERRATRLRGMATDPGHTGRGLAGVLLADGIERCRVRGDAVIWANARVTALGFYERAGFEVLGPEFRTAETGLPHRRVRQVLR